MGSYECGFGVAARGIATVEEARRDYVQRYMCTNGMFLLPVKLWGCAAVADVAAELNREEICRYTHDLAYGL